MREDCNTDLGGRNQEQEYSLVTRSLQVIISGSVVVQEASAICCRWPRTKYDQLSRINIHGSDG